jgi:hypothetical protein
MSEAMTGGAPATTSAPASAPSTGGAAQSSASIGNKPLGGSQAPVGAPSGHESAGGQAAAQAAARELAAQDFDALVTVKINGQEKKVPIKEAIKNYQLEQASQERMRQVAEERRRVQSEQARLKEIKSNPEKLAEYLGLDLDNFAEERLARKYELQQMDPHQRKALELEQKLKTFEAQESQTKQQYLDQIKDVMGGLPEGADKATKEQLHAYLQHQKQVYAQEQQRYNQEIAQAWKETGLPAYSSVGKDIAFQMLKAQKQGRSLQPSEAAAIVKEERLSSAREMLGSMDAKAIQEFLGEELMKKLRDYDVERVTQSKGPQFNTQNSPGPQPASNQKKYLNQMEWRKAMGIG